MKTQSPQSLRGRAATAVSMLLLQTVIVTRFRSQAIDPSLATMGPSTFAEYGNAPLCWCPWRSSIASVSTATAVWRPSLLTAENAVTRCHGQNIEQACSTNLSSHIVPRPEPCSSRSMSATVAGSRPMTMPSFVALAPGETPADRLCWLSSRGCWFVSSQPTARLIGTMRSPSWMPCSTNAGTAATGRSSPGTLRPWIGHSEMNSGDGTETSLGPIEWATCAAWMAGASRWQAPAAMCPPPARFIFPPVGSLTCPPTTHVTLRDRPLLGDLLMAGTTCRSSMPCRHVSDDYVSSGTVSWLPGGQWFFPPVGGPWTSSFTRAHPLPEGDQSCMQLHMQYPYVEPQMPSKHYMTTRWLACSQLQLHMQYQHVEPQMHVQYPGTRKILYGNATLPQSVPQLWTGQPMRTHRVTAEQGLTRHSHALRHLEHLDDWLWGRCTILKRYGKYRLSTCIGCQWLPIRPEILNIYIRRPVRDTTPASYQQAFLSQAYDEGPPPSQFGGHGTRTASRPSTSTLVTASGPTRCRCEGCHGFHRRDWSPERRHDGTSGYRDEAWWRS